MAQETAREFADRIETIVCKATHATASLEEVVAAVIERDAETRRLATEAAAKIARNAVMPEGQLGLADPTAANLMAVIDRCNEMRINIAVAIRASQATGKMEG